MGEKIKDHLTRYGRRFCNFGMKRQIYGAHDSHDDEDLDAVSRIYIALEHLELEGLMSLRRSSFSF